MRVFLAAAAVMAIAACGDKVPQSEAAKELGNVPAQTRDRAVENTTRALQQGAERNADAEKRQ
ncbi:MAG: hypothetical protein AB7O31_10580 [Burkholderiales bacterium]